MKLGKSIFLLGAVGALAACEPTGPDKTQDRQIFDVRPLSNLTAGIWVDPNGCDHWIIDDGAEGYLSQRLDKYGKPFCSGTAPPTVATGPFKEGSSFPDSI